MTMAEMYDLQAWKGRLSTSKQGVKKNVTNLMLFLHNLPELGDKLRWNEMANAVEWNGQKLEEHHLIDIRMTLEKHDFEPKPGDLLAAIVRHARDRTYHPVRDYLDALEWDGKLRLDHWLRACMGAPETAFVRAAGRRTLIAAVARAFRPGCKVDTVLILEGAQGIRKSTAISTLFGAEYTLESVSLFDDHRRMVDAMMGKWVVELAEFVTVLHNNEAKVKGMISMQVDTTTLAYAKSATDHPRHVIFIGTYNPDGMGYFNDGTGNRRFWPVPVTAADIGKIAAVRDQIWAEATAMFKAGEQWWMTDEEEGLARREVDDRHSVDVWEEVLYEKLVRTGVYDTSVAAALQAIGVPPERMDKRARNRVAQCLRKLNYQPDKNPTKDTEGRSVKVFRRGPE